MGQGNLRGAGVMLCPREPAHSATPATTQDLSRAPASPQHHRPLLLGPRLWPTRPYRRTSRREGDGGQIMIITRIDNTLIVVDAAAAETTKMDL